MPATPFHFGPGLLLKAVLGQRMSFGTFVLVQYVVDLESISNILLNRSPVHDHLHTTIGACLVATLVAPVSRQPLNWLLGRIRAHGTDGLASDYLSEGTAGYARRLAAHTRLNDALKPMSWSASAAGALLGAITHVLLDGVIHPDMSPFAPWIRRNPLLIDGSFIWMHVACLTVGALSLLLWPLLSGARTQSK